jgi:hypothetical protein
MPELKRIVLDVLKPHQPNILELAAAVAALGADYHVQIDVIEVDEKTETVTLEVHGERLEFARIEQAIRELGGSVHSIDKALMTGDGPSGD